MKHNSAPVITLMDLHLPLPFRELEGRFRDLGRYAEVAACEFLPETKVNQIVDTEQNNDTKVRRRTGSTSRVNSRSVVIPFWEGKKVFRYLTVPTMADAGPGIIFAFELDFVLDGAAVAGTGEFHLGFRSPHQREDEERCLN